MGLRMIGFSYYDEFVSAGTDGGYALARAYRSGDEFVHDWALRLCVLDRCRGGSVEAILDFAGLDADKSEQ